MSGVQPGYESGATPASELVPPSTGTRPAPPPLPWPQRPVRRREPDRVRHAALGLAVELHAGAVAYPPDPEVVLHTARTFEPYLAGEEAP